MLRVQVLYWCGLRKRRTLVVEPGAWSQSDSLVAEDFGHAPERLVELEIFIDAFDRSTLGYAAPVGSAAQVVPLTTADNVFLNLCAASRYVENAAVDLSDRLSYDFDST